ncbi:hypothetical protein EMPS_09517 [Entomortierella parvispora]|uniref:Uncharacterized protein n=1 Tax=Entomortierella parvispora TaxID=205924 RepID=A0A9P3HIH4_9FUNG|nr:hypothetical protein EMPS_09517 [Entomortierella parvispora]
MLPVVSAPVPRSARAQMFLDCVNRDGVVDASVEAESAIHPCGHATRVRVDKNTDLDSTYHEMIMNGPQQQHRQGDRRRREGATEARETSHAQISAESKQRLRQLRQQQQQLHSHLQQPLLASLPRPTPPSSHQAKEHLPPSPPITPTSPAESPSSLAIHLYVHHHHHHHPQPELTVTTQSSSSFPSTSLPSPVSPHLEQDSLATDVSASSPAVAKPRALPCLLPSLCIPECSNDSNKRTMQLPSPTTPPTETSAWFSQPAIATSALNASIAPNAILEDPALPTARQPSPSKCRHRQQRPYSQSLAHLPNPVMSAQLLSTISESDLARMYVHAAHHLHSHQPIRRYVLMKMIMTQAELIQYGRLRAEMPRAPGPSTGALPKRTGFGTEANKGWSARPKVSSNLAQCRVMTAREEEEEEKVGGGRRLINVPWARSLSSFAMLSTGLSLRANGVDQKRRPSSWYEGMLGGGASTVTEDGLGLTEAGLKDRKKKLGGALSSYSESDLYSARRLEELELGMERLEGEDSVEVDDHGGSDKMDRVEDVTEEMDYWTMIRDRNNRSRRRQIRSLQEQQQRSLEPLQQHPTRQLCSEELEPICLESHNIQTHPPVLSCRQMPQQNRQHSISPAQIISSTSSSISTSPSQTGTWNRSNVQLSTKSKGPSGSKKWSSKRRNSHSNPYTLLPSSNGNHSSPSFSSKFLSSVPESQGISSLVMLSLLFGCLYLFQSTNQLYNLQSAFLSIIL